MALISAHYQIGTVASLVIPASDRIQQVHLHNEEHAAQRDIYVGGPEVTVNTGFHLASNETITLSVAAGDQVYAISDGTDRELHTLISRL